MLDVIYFLLCLLLRFPHLLYDIYATYVAGMVTGRKAHLYELTHTAYWKRLNLLKLTLASKESRPANCIAGVGTDVESSLCSIR